MVKIVACLYNKDEKYVSEEYEPSLGFCKATLFASPKADSKKKQKQNKKL